MLPRFDTLSLEHSSEILGPVGDGRDMWDVNEVYSGVGGTTGTQK